MNKVLLFFYQKMIYFLSLLFNFRILEIIRRIKRDFVWNCVCRNFKKLGRNSKVGDSPQIKGSQYVEIGDNFKGGSNLCLECWDSYQGSGKIFNPELCIGNNVTFTSDTQISCAHKVVIGDNCLFGRYVYVSDNTHGRSDYSDLDIPPIKRELSLKGSVIIGKNVWVGRCTTILSGVTIGDNAIIGANSVVNRNIPANCVAAGVPAKVIRYKEI